jgi:cell division protein FtsB
MPPAAEITRQPGNTRHRKPGTSPLRRKRIPAPPAFPQWRSWVNYLLLFVTVVLIVDGLVGEKGFMDTMRVRRQWLALARSVEDIRQENARLLELARRLREDPATLESIAREEHGLIRPGEILVILKDVKPAAR